MVAFALGEFAIPRLHLFVEPWNVASSRTAEAAGFRREALLRGWERIDGEQHDAECFALLYEDWNRAG
jgi:RimJ/RimL family protein N-acetyltransferase